MIYVLAALLPPLGLLLNGQPFSAIFNLVLIVFCAIFGLAFHVLWLVPSAHVVMALVQGLQGIREAYTFDDVLLKPGLSDILPSEVDIRSRVTLTIPRNIP